MKHVEVQGVSIPALGLGTWRMIGKTCARAVENALNAGYRHIDTAEAYDNEEAVAKGIKGAGVNREDLFITAKISYNSLTFRNVRASLESSLRKLNTPYVDLWLIHWPNPRMALSDTLETMLRLRDEGKALNLGVSNFSIKLLEEALRYAPILCNQVEYHPYLSQKALLPFATKRDLMVTAYAPLAKGRVLKDSLILQIAERLGRTPAQVVLRWLIQQENVAAIPKTENRDHCVENLDIFDFELNEEDTQAIARLDRGERLVWPEFAPEWKP